MKKVMLVFGTRPEAIKMCPLVKELQTRASEVETIVCVTGQHKEMLAQVLRVFEVTPDYDLDIMKKNQTLFDITTSVLLKMNEVLEKVRPDIVLVHGDTSTAFASALACFYKQIPVGHVEAGLRTYNIYSPFPEEFNRQCISLLSSLDFAPTVLAYEALRKAGKPVDSIFVTGNTGIDALRYTVKDEFSDENLNWAKGSRLILLTAHRRENLGRPMEQMFRAVKRVVDEFADVKVIYPIHLNPRVRQIARDVFGDDERIRLIEPLDVVAFHNYMKRSYLVLTDSGGIQEEAPSLGKPVLVMRETTERPEGVAAGTLKLVGVEEDYIYRSFKELLLDENQYRKMSEASNPYGDGRASKRIADALLQKLNNEQKELGE